MVLKRVNCYVDIKKQKTIWPTSLRSRGNLWRTALAQRRSKKNKQKRFHSKPSQTQRNSHNRQCLHIFGLMFFDFQTFQRGRWHRNETCFKRARWPPPPPFSVYVKMGYHNFFPFSFILCFQNFPSQNVLTHRYTHPLPPTMVKYTDLTWKSNTRTAYSKEHTYRHAHFYQTEPESQDPNPRWISQNNKVM